VPAKYAEAGNYAAMPSGKQAAINQRRMHKMLKAKKYARLYCGWLPTVARRNLKLPVVVDPEKIYRAKLGERRDDDTVKFLLLTACAILLGFLIYIITR